MAHAGDRCPPVAVSGSLARVAREWTRIGLTGFEGPPAHIALLRALVVERTGWMDALHQHERGHDLIKSVRRDGATPQIF
jgi:hypothetical protein